MEEKIGDILKRIFKQAGKESVYYEGILKNRWNDIVGDFLAKGSKPDRISDGTLYIKCFNSSIKQEIFFLKNRISEKINSYFNKKLVDDIRVFFKWK